MFIREGGDGVNFKMFRLQRKKENCQKQTAPNTDFYKPRDIRITKALS